MQISRGMPAAFCRIDALLLPATAAPPPVLGAFGKDGLLLELGQRLEEHNRWTSRPPRIIGDGAQRA